MNKDDINQNELPDKEIEIISILKNLIIKNF